MKNIITALISLVYTVSYAQVGIGTNNPKGILDINNDARSNSWGLVLPTAESTNIITNPNPEAQGIISGTIFYDSTADCIKYYKTNNVWSNCLDTTNKGVTLLSCEKATYTGDTQSYVGSQNTSSDINVSFQIQIPYVGSGGSYQDISITSSNVSGITATASSDTIPYGESVLILNASGVPTRNTSSSNAKFQVNMGNKSCEVDVPINFMPFY